MTDLLDFTKLLALPEADLASLLAELAHLEGQGRYHAAVSRFLAHLPIHAPALYPEGYFRNQLGYLWALLAAQRGDAREAAEAMTRAQVGSAGDWDDLVFSEHVLRANEMAERQRQAIAAGKPGILITALPKSASAFLSNLLADALDMPLLRTSIGSFPKRTVVPGWMRQVAQGGCVTHDHFDGSRANLTPIVQSGFRVMFVQVRDPRAALWSYSHFERTVMNTLPVHDFEELIDLFYVPANAWIASWLEAAQSLVGNPRIVILHYGDVAKDPVGLCAAVLEAYGAGRFAPDVKAFLDAKGEATKPSQNFRSGNDEQWREQLAESVRDRLWDLTPPVVRDFMQMQP